MTVLGVLTRRSTRGNLCKIFVKPPFHLNSSQPPDSIPNINFKNMAQSPLQFATLKLEAKKKRGLAAALFSLGPKRGIVENSKDLQGAPSFPRSVREAGNFDLRAQEQSKPDSPPVLPTKRRGEVAEAAFLHKA